MKETRRAAVAATLNRSTDELVVTPPRGVEAGAAPVELASLIVAGIVASYGDQLMPSRHLETAIDNFPFQQLRWRRPGCRSLTTVPPNR
jgi:hypothetical protein